MILSSLIGVLTGLLIGGRFKVFATVPVQAVAFLLAMVPVWCGDQTPYQALLAFVCFSISLQAGYVIMALRCASTHRLSPGEPFKI